MAVAVVICARETFRGVALPLAAVIGEDANADEAVRALEKLKGFIGSEAFEKLSRAFDEALKDEIYVALNTVDLERELPLLVEKFWARIALPVIELNNAIYALDAASLGVFKEIEEELAKAIAKLIKNSDYRRADDLIYALSVLVDRDLWILNKTSRLGLDNLTRKLTDRALSTLSQFLGYTVHLAFTWTAVTAAVLGIVKEYREVNRDVLATWSREYAEELESCLDTLDLLLDDEVYEDLVELGILKR